MEHIRIIISKLGPYDPEALMLRYAHENVNIHTGKRPWEYKFGQDGTLYLFHKSKTYEFDHWEIKPIGGNLDEVTIFLKETAYPGARNI